MKMINVTKWAVVIACIGFMALASQVRATALTFTDIHVLGTVTDGSPADPSSVATYINFMITLPSPGAGTFSGQDITRSSNAFASLPTAVATGAVTGGGTAINLGTSGYVYLWAKYDGQNDISQVWFVGDLSGSVTIPPQGPLGHDLSGWTLFNPGGQVPDGGSTVLLLGAALSAIGVVRRYVKR